MKKNRSGVTVQKREGMLELVNYFTLTKKFKKKHVTCIAYEIANVPIVHMYAMYRNQNTLSKYVPSACEAAVASYHL